jgi:hypothetical protein
VDVASAPASAHVRYELGDEAARSRAVWTAVLGSAAALGPVALVVVIAQKLGWTSQPWMAAGVAALGALALARGALSFVRLRRRLRAFRVAIEDDAIVVTTASAELRVGREAIVKVTELEGALGGLRVQLRDDDALPERIDIPRGGSAYGALRASIATMHAIERAPRRGAITRFVIGAAVVAGIFFLPFFFEDFVVRSKGIALALVLAMWLAARLVARR